MEGNLKNCVEYLRSECNESFKMLSLLLSIHPFIGSNFSPSLVIRLWETVMWGMWVEKLSALNFRLVSPETWKSWHWVSGNQELPPDFHLQSWQKFRTLLKAGNIWSTWNYNFLALIYLSLHDWTMELIRVQGNILLRRMEKSQQRRESSFCVNLNVWDLGFLDLQR